jgi:hypothetical protein
MAHCYDIILDMSYGLWMMIMGNGQMVFNFHATMKMKYNDYYRLNFNVLKTNKVCFVSMINLCFLGYDELATKPFWELLKLGFVFHDEQCARLTCFFFV